MESSRCSLPEARFVVKVTLARYLLEMHVTLNGEQRELRDGLSVAELIGDLQLNLRRIAVEINEQVLARDAYQSRRIAAGDIIEIVQFIGGG